MDDVVQECIEVVLGFDYLVVVDVRLLDLNVVRQLIKYVFDLLLVLGLYVFPHQAKGVAVSDGFVIVVFVDVIAEYLPRGTFFFEERSTGKGYLDAVPVCIKQVGEETTFGVVTTMGFVNEEYTNEVDVVCFRNVDFTVVFFEFLDVDDHYLRLSISIANHSITAEVRHQLLTAICFADVQTSHGKLI